MKKIVKKLITKKNSEKSKLEKNQGGYEKKERVLLFYLFLLRHLQKCVDYRYLAER